MTQTSKTDLFHLLVKRTLRLPMPKVEQGRAPVETSEAVVRGLDTCLMEQGFKLSGEAMAILSTLDRDAMVGYGREVLAVVKGLLGSHRQHNTLFRGFPDKVPQTTEQWLYGLHGALVRSGVRRKDGEPEHLYVVDLGDEKIDLLKSELLYFGRYGHTYRQMVACHRQFQNLLKGSLKILTLGGTLEEEAERLFRSLTGSTVPLSEDDTAILQILCPMFSDLSLESVPMREVKAIVNVTRLRAGSVLIADTVTDVLRVMALQCGGDVSLEKPTKFTKISRGIRRAVMKALEVVISFGDYRLGDVLRHQEMWKRLGEKIHPHEFPKLELARDVFAVARGDKTVRTPLGTAEMAFKAGDIPTAVRALGKMPGVLFRSLDRVLMALPPGPSTAWADTLWTVEAVIGKVSGRVLLSVAEHLMNRVNPSITGKRLFPTRSGKSYVKDETRRILDEEKVLELIERLDAEITQRLPVFKNLTVDPDVMGVALPLTEKNKPQGLGVLPRGSVTDVKGDVIRFFYYWRQTSQVTDHDLSILLMDAEFNTIDHVSYTRLATGNGSMTHSGDVRDGTHGASEFINVNLDRVPSNCWFLVPQVNVFGGEGFDEVEECFGGYLEMASLDQGLPFEPKAVRTKTDLKGKGKVALPMMFVRTPGGWVGKWMHLYSKGDPQFNRVETNKFSTGLQARGIHGREFLSVGFLADRLLKKAVVDPTSLEKTYIGLNTPEDPEGTRVYTPMNFHELIPA